jgi:hypothetical protein
MRRKVSNKTSGQKNKRGIEDIAPETWHVDAAIWSISYGGERTHEPIDIAASLPASGSISWAAWPKNVDVDPAVLELKLAASGYY